MNRTASPVAVVTRFIEDVINGGKSDLVEELWAKDMGRLWIEAIGGRWSPR